MRTMALGRVAAGLAVVAATLTASPPGRPSQAAQAAGCVVDRPATCTLRELADRAGVRLGGTLEPAEIALPDYARTLSQEFSALTAENAMKWYATEQAPGVFTFDDADAVLQFAMDHGMAVRGHNLVWAQDDFTPQWVKDLTDPAAMRAAVHAHLDAVLGRYQGRIHRWDVVNEPLSSAGATLSDNVYARVLGPDWLAETYRYAHEVDPAAELWLNEYGSDWVPGKHQALLRLLRGLLADGVPIDGIGLQTHRLSVDGPDRATFERQLRDYASLGLKVAITELDVAVRPDDPKGLSRQAQAYATIVSSCLAVPRCEEVTLWGVTDARTWLDGQGLLPAPTRPLLFDGDYQPKPAYRAVRDVLAGGRAGATATSPLANPPATTTVSTSTTAAPSPPSAGSPAVAVPGSPSFTG